MALITSRDKIVSHRMNSAIAPDRHSAAVFWRAVMGLPARGAPGLGASGAAQTNRCSWISSSHEKQTAIKPKASLVMRAQIGPADHPGAALAPHCCTDDISVSISVIQ